MIQRITATAELDERPEATAITRARANSGDADNAWVLDQWRHGLVLVARITIVAYAQDSGGQPLEAQRVQDDVWLERRDVPEIESQVADLAAGALAELASELRDRGVTVDTGALQDSYLHVKLGERLLAALGGGG